MTKKKNVKTNVPSPKVLQELHRKMVRIRKFEESAGKMMEDGKIPGALHLYVGQEAVASGVMQHLSNKDWITSTHRGHGHLVAKGGEFKPMFAELFGRSTGYCRGKGGSMHISNMELGMLGANGIVGGGPPIAMGAAFSNKFKKNKNVSVAFFGDGASTEGSVHEAANMAALYKLPCVFVCENNGYGEYTPQSRHQAIVDVADRASGYGMPGVSAMEWMLWQFMKLLEKQSTGQDRVVGRPYSSAKPTGTTIMLASGEWALIIELTRKSRNGKIKMR